MTVKQILQQDLLRYDIRKPVSLFLLLKLAFTHVAPGVKFSIAFRYCQHYRRKNRVLFYFFFRLLRRVKYKYGFDISYRTVIGPGLYIGHFGGIVIHGDTVIGSNCNLSQGMTIGVLARGKNAGIPKIGDRVFIGPGALILGGISIGNDVLIGANSVVTFDVADFNVVAAPASAVISQKGSDGYIINTQ
ncbi:serine O-acetyltransferase [Flavobacterium silvaticum]|uniref:Serine acetyltransferase n=1 Tax=Flavobacterium silvaticum TaxID=1852020 RepID=A0A972FXJ4_9FLAO|nr:serine acetyltransferase [Flavobacterium silvaticum]NMH29480.1 serine acetyltransferase [Flavobacterium silvaticum]